MIDTSHGNSEKDWRRQPRVAEVIGEQVAQGDPTIVGVMMESFLVEGRQDVARADTLTYGQSITDGCLGWEATRPALQALAEAVRARRRVRALSGAASSASGGDPSDHPGSPASSRPTSATAMTARDRATPRRTERKKSARGASA